MWLAHFFCNSNARISLVVLLECFKAKFCERLCLQFCVRLCLVVPVSVFLCVRLLGNPLCFSPTKLFAVDYKKRKDCYLKTDCV